MWIRINDELFNIDRFMSIEVAITANSNDHWNVIGICRPDESAVGEYSGYPLSPQYTSFLDALDFLELIFSVLRTRQENMHWIRASSEDKATLVRKWEELGNV